ncbi:Uncharacterized protein Adt_11591 [Abeliophyllum distichum]|uniref:Reverse transcriptase zinc-binding domain-containing protein n=1 Tax=Abeliophyllum distichum TaxID=126358 RepID=A0ABD1UNP3_9LAMI
MWLTVNEKLLTRDRILNVDIDRGCIFYQQSEELAAHLFFQCRFSSIVWTNIRSWLGIHRSISTIASSFKWIKKEGRVRVGKAKRRGLHWPPSLPLMDRKE